jgi:hypothetical protein
LFPDILIEKCEKSEKGEKDGKKGKKGKRGRRKGELKLQSSRKWTKDGAIGIFGWFGIPLQYNPDVSRGSQWLLMGNTLNLRNRCGCP